MYITLSGLPLLKVQTVFLTQNDTSAKLLKFSFKHFWQNQKYSMGFAFRYT